MNEFPTQERFKQWLLSREGDEIISQNWTCCDCPLARYIRAEQQGSPIVQNSRWWPTLAGFGGAYEAIPLPNWAREFVYWVDKVKPREVTADDCLFILNLASFKPDRWNGQ